MFTTLASTLQPNQVIDISVSAVGADGRMKIIVKPQLAKGATTALAQPLALIATPQELDAEFATVLSQFTSDRQSLQQQVDVTSTIIGDAKKVEVGKATKAIQAGGKQAGNKDVEVDANDDGDHDADGVAAAGGGEGILDDATHSTGPQTTSASGLIPALIPSGSNNDDLLSLMS